MRPLVLNKVVCTFPQNGTHQAAVVQRPVIIANVRTLVTDTTSVSTCCVPTAVAGYHSHDTVRGPRVDVQACPIRRYCIEHLVQIVGPFFVALVWVLIAGVVWAWYAPIYTRLPTCVPLVSSPGLVQPRSRAVTEGMDVSSGLTAVLWCGYDAVQGPQYSHPRSSTCTRTRVQVRYTSTISLHTGRPDVHSCTCRRCALALGQHCFPLLQGGPCLVCLLCGGGGVQATSRALLRSDGSGGVVCELHCCRCVV